VDAAWARVRREISQVARQDAEQIRRRSLSRAWALLRYHAGPSLNPAYRDLLADAGVDPAVAGPGAVAWQRVPIIDKGWLAGAGYDRQPACPGPVLIVGTSGSTATQVLVPVTARCARRGLGDNFGRALAMSGTGPGHRHWGIEHRPAGQGQGVTGSSISMTWLSRHSRDNALVTAATTALDEQLGRLRARFPQARLTAFYPTTEAGALGAAPGDDGVYRTFCETHLIEIVDQAGQPVPAGARGDVVVTQFDAQAAPIIRYRVGDQATYQGWEAGRLLLSGIERSAEAAIGSTLVPYRDLRTWAPRLTALGHPVVAVQLVRTHSPGEAREKPVVRVIGPASGADAELAAAALALLDDFPQIASEIASGELAPPRAEFRDPPASLAGHWKIPLYVDERTRAEDPCPSD
jgi:hypothetical protein